MLDQTLRLDPSIYMTLSARMHFISSSLHQPSTTITITKNKNKIHLENGSNIRDSRHRIWSLRTRVPLGLEDDHLARGRNTGRACPLRLLAVDVYWNDDALKKAAKHPSLLWLLLPNCYDRVRAMVRQQLLMPLVFLPVADIF